MSHPPHHPSLPALALAATAVALLACAEPAARGASALTLSYAAVQAEQRGEPVDSHGRLPTLQRHETRPGEALPAQRSFRAPVDPREVMPGTPLPACGGPSATAVPAWLPRLGSTPAFGLPSRCVLFCTWLA